MFGRSVRADLRERTRGLPGDELVANPVGSVTHVITTQRPPREVWPWLVQMGAGRAGWYRYDRIDSLVLGWLPGADAAPATTWALVLEEPEPGRTRLINGIARRAEAPGRG